MAKILIHSDSASSATSVSNIFIDEYMSDANGEFVKIYLYLLRLMNAPDSAFSVSSIADKFEHTEKDVKRALSYWERMHLLRLEYDTDHNLTGVCLIDSASRDKTDVTGEFSENESAAEAPDSNSISSSADEYTSSDDDGISSADTENFPPKRDYTRDELKQFQENDQIAELLFITERYLGRPLSQTDTNTLLYLYEELSFSPDLIEYLVEYCVSKNHTAIRYIEATALKWAESGIRTVTSAKQEAKIHSPAYYAVMRSFGITGRNLVPSETDFIEKWRSEYGFSIDIICAACQQTIQSIHQPSFPYTDKMLSNWRKLNVHTMEDVKRLNLEHKERAKTSAQEAAGSKNKFNNIGHRSYEYDELEKMLLTTNSKR